MAAESRNLNYSSEIDRITKFWVACLPYGIDTNFENAFKRGLKPLFAVVAQSKKEKIISLNFVTAFCNNEEKELVAPGKDWPQGPLTNPEVRISFNGSSFKIDVKIDGSKLKDKVNEAWTGKDEKADADGFKLLNDALIERINEAKWPTYQQLNQGEIQIISPDQYDEIRGLAQKLENEINSSWPYPNKDQKRVKVKALKALITNILENPNTYVLDEHIKPVEKAFPEATKGSYSHRVADLLQELREAPTYPLNGKKAN